eukprot:g1162.t1
MTSLTTNPSHAKRRRTTLKPATIEALEEERAEPIEIGTLVLPAGFESAGDMTLKDMASQFGKNSYAYERTPLMIAAQNEHFQIVKYLIEQGEADPNIAHSEYGMNALHYAAKFNRTNTELIQLLLTHMSLNSINKKNRGGYTPLDRAYSYNDSPIRQEIIALLRSKGGKANCHDVNGRNVGDGNGDLNH